MTGTAGRPGLRPCTGGRPPGPARGSSCRPRLARSAGSRAAAPRGPWPRSRRAPVRGHASGRRPRRDQAEAGLRVARFLGAAAVAEPSPSAASVDALADARFFGAAGLASAVAVSPPSDPAVAAGLRVARFLGAVVGARRARGLGRCARLGRRPALAVRSRSRRRDVGAACRLRRSTPGPVPLPRGLVASCARSWASSSGGTSLHSPDSRLGAGERSPWSGRGPRLSGRGPRSYERSCGAAVRPLTSG